MATIETPHKKFEISSTEHENKQEWRQHLYLVSSFPNRLVGLITDPEPPKLLAGGIHITLYGSLMYIAELVFQPVVQTDENGQPKLGADRRPIVVGVQGGTKLQLLAPYDFLGSMKVEITQAQYLMKVDEMDAAPKKWFCDEYLRVFDPSQVVKPGR